MVLVKIKTRNDVLSDVIRDGKKHPKGWKAVFGKDDKLFSNDYYIYNPKIGIYLLKEYEKNPYEIKGIGSKIARHIDNDVEEEITKLNGDFGIIQGDFQKILTNLEKGIHPEKIFNAAIKGKKDYGISMPIRGKASSSKDAFGNLHSTLKSKQTKLDLKFKKIATDDGLYKSYD